MTSQAVRRTLKLTPLSNGRVEATFELVCGCSVTREVDSERFVTLADGSTLLGGKYPCPADHPAGHTP